MKYKSNKGRCKVCGDIIESKRVHDMVWCSCRTCAVDGGLYYLKRSVKAINMDDVFEEMSEENEDSE